jgi:hypothetical protein
MSGERVTVTVKTVTTTDAGGKVTTETITTIDGDPASMTRAIELLTIAQQLADLGKKL